MGTDPEVAITILKEGCDQFARQSIRYCVVCKLAILKAAQSRVPGSKPNCSIVVLVNGVYVGGCQPLFLGIDLNEMLLKLKETLPFSAYPSISFVIDVKSGKCKKLRAAIGRVFE